MCREPLSSDKCDKHYCSSQFALCRVKNRESEFGEKCDEYERQIKHLRQLLREKDDASNLLEMEKKSAASLLYFCIYSNVQTLNYYVSISQ